MVHRYTLAAPIEYWNEYGIPQCCHGVRCELEGLGTSERGYFPQPVAMVGQIAMIFVRMAFQCIMECSHKLLI